MSDQPRKPAAALHSAVPKEVQEFVRYRRDSVDIAPELPDFPGFTISFEDGADGSITILLDGPGDFLDSSIVVTIQNGHLVADTSNVKFGREFVDKWIKDFNVDLDAPPAKQLSSVSIRDGKLHVTKSPVIADTETPRVQPPMTPQEPSHHAGHPLPEPVAVGTPDDPAADGSPPAPLPDHVLDPIPPPVKVETEEVITTTDSIPDLTDLGTDAESGSGTEGEQEPEIGFIEDPPMSDAARRLRIYRRAGGVAALAVIAVFLFGSRGDDTPVVPPSDQAVEAVGDPEPSSANEDQPSAEPASDQEPVSSSVQVTDPAGDNGRDGTGADILGLEYVQDEEAFMVLLTMGFSPLESSILWYSYYLEVTLRTVLGNVHVLIWENHAGASRSGELDSSGNASGAGVTLTDEAAEFRKTLDPDDRVVEISVVAFSLVEQEDSVTEDRMEVEVDIP